MPNVGSVYVDARIDGDRWPSDLRRAMSRAGKALDQEAMKAAKRAANTLSRGLKGAQDDLKSQFRELGKSLIPDSVLGSFRRFREGAKGHLESFRETLRQTATDARDSWRRLVPDVDALKRTFPGVTRAMEGVNREIQKQRRHLGVLRDAWKGIVTPDAPQAIQGLGAAMSKVRPYIRKVRDEVQLTGYAFGYLRKARKDIADFNQGLRDQARDSRGLGRAMDDLGRKTGGLLSKWKNLSHNTRQWTLIIAAIAAAAAPIAVLGSALGGTLAAVGAMGTALASAIGVGIAGFRGLYDETITLSSGAAAAKRAFSDLGGALKTLQGSLTNAMFADMAGSISNLKDRLIPGIATAVENMASATGQALGRIFDALSSDKAIGVFNELLEGSAPIIDSLTDAVIGFGGAFGNIFAAAMPLAQTFAAAIGDVGMRFLEWSSSDAGRERIADWLNTAATIMPKVMDLFASTGRAIADLVTPQTIQQTGDFLDNLSRAMPGISDLLSILGGLNIFGVIAGALAALGAVITPLAPPLQAIGYFLSEAALAALKFVEVGLGAVLRQLQPVLAPVAAGFTALGDAFRYLRTTGDLAGFFSQMISAVSQMLPAIINGISTMLQNVVALIATNVPTIVSVWAEGLTGMVTTIADVLPQLISDLATAMTTLVQTIATVAPILLDAGLQLFMGLVDALLEVAPILVDTVVQLIPQLVSTITTMLPLIIDAALTLFMGLIEGLTQAIPQVMSALQAALPVIIDSITTVLPALIQGAITLFLGLVTGLTQAMPQIVNAIVTLIPSLVTAIVSILPFLIEGAIQLFLGIITGLTAALPMIVSALVGAIPQLVSALVGALPLLIEGAILLFLGIIDGLAQALPMIIMALLEAIPIITEALIGATPQIIEAGIQLFMGLVEAIPQIAGDLFGAVGDLLGGVWGIFTGQKPEAKEQGKGLMASANEGMSGQKGALTSTADTLGSTVNSTLSGYQNKFQTTGSTLGSKANAGLYSHNGAFRSTGSTLGQTATDALAGKNSALTNAATTIGSNANSALAAQAGAFNTTGSTLGQYATTGLSSNLGDMRSTADNLGISVADGINSKSGEAESAARNLGQDVISGLKSTNAAGKSAGADLARQMNAGLASVGGSIKSTGAALGRNAASGALSVAGQFRSIGSQMASGMASGIYAGGYGVAAAARSIAANAAAAARAALDIRSPSRVFMQIGEYTGQGLADGIESMSKTVAKVSSGLADAAVRGMGSIGDNDYKPKMSASPVGLGYAALSESPWSAALATGGMGSTTTTNSKNVTIEPGAIQILGSLDPRRTAIETVDELVERIA